MKIKALQSEKTVKIKALQSEKKSNNSEIKALQSEIKALHSEKTLQESYLTRYISLNIQAIQNPT